MENQKKLEGARRWNAAWLKCGVEKGNIRLICTAMVPDRVI